MSECSSEFWTAFGATASAVAAAVAAIALVFLACQVRDARKNTTIDSLLKFFDLITKSEGKLLEGKSEDEKENAFFELTNIIEIYATALDGNTFPPLSRQLIRHKLIDMLGIILHSEHWGAKLKEARLSPDTFIYLDAFHKANKSEIDKAIARNSAT